LIHDDLLKRLGDGALGAAMDSARAGNLLRSSDARLDRNQRRFAPAKICFS
jgi:hypothetical protein